MLLGKSESHPPRVSYDLGNQGGSPKGILVLIPW